MEAAVQFPALAAVAILQWLNPLVFHQQQMVLCQLWQTHGGYYKSVPYYDAFLFVTQFAA